MGGIANAVGSVFGMSSGGSTPDIPQTPVRENEAEAESRAVRNEEQRKIKARRGMAGTILTQPTGQSGGVLGRLGQQ